MKEGRYWERKKERMCRVCGLAEKGWKNVWEDCGI